MSHPESTWSRVENSLLQTVLFKEVDRTRFGAFIRQGLLHRYDLGQSLTPLLSKRGSLSFLVDGHLRSITQISNDEQRPLRKVGPGSPLGLVDAINQIRTEHYLASERCVILELPLVQVMKYLDQESQVKAQLLNRPYPEEIAHILTHNQPVRYDLLDQLKSGEVPFPFGVLPKDQLPELVEGSQWLSPSQFKSRGEVGSVVRWFQLPASLLQSVEVETLAVPSSSPQVSQESPPPEPLNIPVTFDGEVILAKPGVAAAVACMQMIAKSGGKKFRAEVVTRYLKEQTGDIAITPTLNHLGAAAEMQGWPARLLKISVENLLSVEAPALLFKNGQPVYLQSNRGGSLCLASPAEGPLVLKHEEIKDHFPSSLEVLTITVPEGDAPKKFGISWFIPVLKKHRKVLLEVFFASLLVQVFALANPVVTQLIIDKVLVQNSPGTLHVLGILLGILVIAGTVTSALRTYLFVDTTNRIDLTLGGKVADRLYRLTSSYFGRRPVGEISSRLNELENIRQFLTGTVLTILLDGLFAIIYIALMLFYSVKLTLVALAALPLFAFITLMITPIYQAQIRQRARDRASSQAYLVETITGIQTIKSQNLEHRARLTWQERYATYIASSFRTTITSTTFSSLTGMLGKFSDLAVLWVGTLLVIDGKLTLGQLIAFRIISGYVSNPLLRLIQSWQNFQEAALSVERLGDVMNAETEQLPEQAASIPLPTVKGEVVFENLSYRYQSNMPQTLSNISAHIEPGMFVGVVGLSGSGKSTLVKTLTRLCTPESGKVLIDGYDISKVELSSVRSQVATVLQDSLLFDVSIEENIALSKPSATSEEVMRAANIARAHDFIMKMPLGYTTPAGEQGRNMSGGQRQRVALARSILQNPRVLVLDEATSALDVPTEREVCHNLRKEFQDRTIFFVTHRLHNLDQADLILVLEDGVLIESGSHTQLISKKGLYATLYKQIQG